MQCEPASSKPHSIDRQPKLQPCGSDSLITTLKALSPRLGRTKLTGWLHQPAMAASSTPEESSQLHGNPQPPDHRLFCPVDDGVDVAKVLALPVPCSLSLQADTSLLHPAPAHFSEPGLLYLVSTLSLKVFSHAASFHLFFMSFSRLVPFFACTEAKLIVPFRFRSALYSYSGRLNRQPAVSNQQPRHPPSQELKNKRLLPTRPSFPANFSKNTPLFTLPYFCLPDTTHHHYQHHH
ncbi:hypothetical protein F4775DRAFT_369545 [Biscogniauxia sp. FL1348]|nr:hypothetical protein F4775DRAFT_369545 [Biscogniauxia sp. FL1348]